MYDQPSCVIEEVADEEPLAPRAPTAPSAEAGNGPPARGDAAGGTVPAKATAAGGHSCANADSCKEPDQATRAPADSGTAGAGAAPASCGARSGDEGEAPSGSDHGVPHHAAASGAPSEGQASACTPPSAAASPADAAPQPAAGAPPSQPAWAPAGDEEQRQLEVAEALKRAGNELYAKEDYGAALAKYQEALDAAPEAAPQRAVYFANMAACSLKLQQPRLAAEQCSCALRIDEGYAKALMRRAAAFEELDDPEHAVADAKRLLELDPSNAWASALARRLGPAVAERQEKLKAEMLGKLKDLGNTVLGKFGLSLDNFKAEQDPSTGSYSIKFQQ